MTTGEPVAPATSRVDLMDRSGSPDEVIVFQVATEGRTLELLGRRRPGGEGWEYRRRRNPRAQPTEAWESVDASAPLTSEEPEWVNTWDEALAQMDQTPWQEKTPLQVHAEFAQRILGAALQRLGEIPWPRNRPELWARACEAGFGVPFDHPLAPLIRRALKHAEFADRWAALSDQSFRPLVALAFALHPDVEWPGADFGRLIERLCDRPRIEILQDWVGKTGTDRLLSWLPRLQWAMLARGEWDELRLLADTENADSPLGQVARITPTLIRQFRAIPEALRVPPILAVARDLEIPVERWERLRRYVERRDAEGQAALIRAAEAMPCSFNGYFWDFYFLAEGKYGRAFDLPDALKNSELLESISTPAAMQAEAERLRNHLASHSSLVRLGHLVYFRPRDGSMINAALVRHGLEWAPGAIVGPRNQPVEEFVAAPLRAELQRLAKHMPSIPASARDSSAGIRNSYTEELRDYARRQFPASDIDQGAKILSDIQHRSRSWAEVAYVIVHVGSMKSGPRWYLKCTASPDGTELIVEISSHHESLCLHERLTADVVELIERCGFEWPIGEANFWRVWSVSSSDDLRALAELALAVLARMFGHSPGAPLRIRSYIPEDESPGTRGMNRRMILIGAVLIAVGVLWPLLRRLHLFSLPGDIIVDRPGFKFFFPITTMLLISVVLSAVLWLFRR